jgi:hypothetical protein
VSVTPLSHGASGVTPKRASEVEIFATAPPQTRFVEVALLEADQSNGLNEQGVELMLLRLREAAGALGCDGIVLTGRGARAPAPYVEGPLPPVDYGSRQIYATCIAFVADSIPRSAMTTVSK